MTLADDPQIGALAQCLGDVVAASVIIDSLPVNPGPAVQFAVGVRRPKAATEVAHAVICTSWQGLDAAKRYAALARVALKSGRSARTQAPWTDFLKQPAVSVVGGSQGIVKLEANTPTRAGQVFLMAQNRDLPAFSR